MPVLASRKSGSRIRALQAASLKKPTWLVHGFSTRSGGFTTVYGGKTLNLGFTKDDARENVEENRSKTLLSIGAGDKRKPWPLVSLRQIHSDIIHIVRAAQTELLTGDGLNQCSGRRPRGDDRRLPPRAAGGQEEQSRRRISCRMARHRAAHRRERSGHHAREFGTRPENVFAAIGPGIQQCCYEVGQDLKDQFESQFSYGSELFQQVKDYDDVHEKYPLLFMNMRAPRSWRPVHQASPELERSQPAAITGNRDPAKADQRA